MRYKFAPPERLQAFTLAEVLIALVIIGVIATITVPTITANHRKEETSARLKKLYSTMNQVILKAQADGNNWDYWLEGADTVTASTPDLAKNFIEQYVLPYMVYHKYETKYLYTYVYLNDGTSFFIKKATCLDFFVDINGDKKPNKFGRDIFAFVYCPNRVTSFETGKFSAYKHKNESRDEILNRCKSTGYDCSGLLEIDGWQFKDDYPYNI